MIYELEYVNKRYDEIIKEIDIVNNKGTDPQSLFIYVKGDGLLSNIKTYFVYAKMLRQLKKLMTLSKNMLDYLESYKSNSVGKKQLKQRKKAEKYFSKKKDNVDADYSQEKYERDPDEIIADLKEIRENIAQLIVKIEPLLKSLREYLFNAVIIAFMPFTVVGYALLTSFLKNNAVDVTATVTAFVCWSGYLAARAVYLIKFTRYYKLDGKAACIKLMYHLSAIFTYFSIDLLFCLTCFGCGDLPAAVLLLILCGVFIFTFLYDIFCSSKFFIGELGYCSFVVLAGAVLCVILFAVENVIISRIVSGFLISVEIGLLLIIFKAFIIEQRKIETLVQIICIIIIVLMSICIGAVLIYRFTWVSPAEGKPADNTLFSAVMGIYAALIGGVLTFTGVAWTIRHNEQQRKADEKMRVRPYLVNSSYSNNHPIYPLLFKNFSNENEEPLIIKKIYVYVTDAADCIFLGLMTKEKFFPMDGEIYTQRNSYHATVELRLPQNTRLNKTYLIVKDLLDNLYKFECKLEACEDGKYQCVDIGIPEELDKNRLQLINSDKQ